MTERNKGLIAEPLFVGATRPSMRWGVTYPALLANMVATMEVFLVTRNLLALLLCLPVHGVCVLLCAHDPRCFELLALWVKTRLPTLLTGQRYWRAGSYSPLVLDLPNACGRRQSRAAWLRC